MNTKGHMSSNKDAPKPSLREATLRKLVVPAAAQTNSNKTAGSGSRNEQKKSTERSRQTASTSHLARATATEIQKTNKQSKPSLERTVAKLRSGDSKKIEEAILLVRKYFITEKRDIERLCQHGIVESLLVVIGGTNQKHLNFALSTLGNMCIESKVKQQIVNLDGVSALAKIVRNVEREDILNRACRTLANLAQNSSACVIIHEQNGLIEAVVSRLNSTEDIDLKKTLLRTLRLFGETPSHRRAVLDEDGLRAIAQQLKYDDDNIATAAYWAIEELTKEFTADCSRQLIAAEAPKCVIQHTDHTDDLIKYKAFTLIMTKWIHHEEMRVGLGNAGGIPFYIDKIETLPNWKSRLMVVNALCLSCQEVVNRVRIRDNQGLQLILRLLNDTKYKLIHVRLISALKCFLYDEQGWQILLSNQLVPTVTRHLGRVACIKPQSGKKTSRCNKGAGTSANLECTNLSETVIVKGSSDTDRVSFTVGSPEEEVIQEHGRAVSPTEKPAKIRRVDQPSEDVTSDLSTQTPDQSGTGNRPEDHKKASDFPTEASAGFGTRYSLDSPTYKAVGDCEDDDYFSGPKNIHESQYHIGGALDKSQASSSPQHQVAYSPMSVVSNDISPDASPVWSRRSPPLFSQDNAPDFPGSGSGQSPCIYSPLCTAPSSQLARTSSPASPLSGEEEDIFNSPAQPTLGQSRLQAAAEYLQYSSEEYDSDTEFNVRIPGTKVACHSLLTLSGTEQKLPDNVSNPNYKKVSPDAPRKSSCQSLVDLDSDCSDIELPRDSKVVSKSKRLPLTCTLAGSRHKRSQTQETREKIRNAVAISSSSSSSSLAEISMILDSSVSSLSEQPENVEVPVNTRDQRRITEHNLLQLLSRVSHCADPSEHLVNQECLVALLRYVRWSTKPLPRCGRTLIRLTSNPLCYKYLILNMAPYLILKFLFVPHDDSSTDQEPQQCKRETQNVSSAVRKRHIAEHKDQVSSEHSHEQPSTSKKIPRSMSAPGTVSESQRALRFRQQARRREQQFDGDSNKEAEERHQEILDLQTTQLSKMAVITDSGYGQGVLANLLQTGTLQEQRVTAVSFTLLCSECEVSSRLLLDLGGLQHVIDVLQVGTNKTLQAAALLGLMTLAERLDLRFHMAKTPETSTMKDDLKSETSRAGTGDSHFDVTFVLDSGDKIMAHRVTLVERSPVFTAMLEGWYIESDQTMIALREVSTKAFKVLIAHLHGNPMSCNDIAMLADPVMGKQSDQFLSLLLEVHAAADRFMQDDLTSATTKMLVEECVSLANLQELLFHGLLHNADWLMEQCLAFLLVGSHHMTVSKRTKELVCILQGKHGPAISQVLHSLFKKAMKK